MAIGCPNCGAELGLRERYERLLRLLEAGLVCFDLNNKFEAEPNNQLVAQAVMEASIQMHKVIGEYWQDIPGDTLREKLAAVAEKYAAAEKAESGIIV